jgi:hypothetical protein
MTSRSKPNGRAATSESPRAPALAVVTVEDRVDERLAAQGARRYTAPAQPIADARTLVRLLLGGATIPAGRGPWRRAIAGGQRVITMRVAEGRPFK